MSVKLKDVTVEFKNRKNSVIAVDHVSAEIGTGIYGLLGENGAGKTTLMRVLTTIRKPSMGEVSMNGIAYTEKNYERLQKKIGYLPQELNLYPSLSVRECLEYMGGLAGVPKEERRRRIDYYLEKTSLAGHQKKKLGQLSGGMKRRVGLIQALLHEPEFLIVDEPTTGLDPEERIRIRNLLVDFSENRTVLLSTHVVEDLAATCSRLAILRKGAFRYDGTVEKLLKEAEGRVWTCTVKNEREVRELEKSYYVSLKQPAREGMKVRILGNKRPEITCSEAEATLEDAYMLMQLGQGRGDRKDGDRDCSG